MNQIGEVVDSGQQGSDWLDQYVAERTALRFLTESTALFYADCLDLLPLIAENSIDAVIVDPPVDMSLKSTHINDVVYWNAIARCLKPMGKLAVICNNRSHRKFIGNLSAMGIGITDHFQWINSRRLDRYVVIGQKGADTSISLENMSHCIIHCNDRRPDYGIASYLSIDPSRYGNLMRSFKREITPLGVICDMLDCVASSGDTILDPFVGSGTTAVACIMKGMRIIGIDKISECIDVADARVRLTIDRERVLRAT